MKILGCLLRPIRKVVGLGFLLLGTIPTLLIPGFGLFLGLPFLVIGGALVCGC
ncbi:MAG TPA: hypothetical protein IGS52_21505 [Oscillatoriaceae cyanobacterium M33_DOE_052]|nr:hypothetical protein [Oscillatoriaceae cyanobacterium M33_DOE_052]